MGQPQRCCDIERRKSFFYAVRVNISSLNATQYRAQDKPWYRLGHGIVLAYIAIGWLSSLLFYFLLKRENASREAGKRDEVIQGVDNPSADEKNGRFKSVEEARTEKGDEWSGFRYTL